MKQVWIISICAVGLLLLTRCSNGSGSFSDGTSPSELVMATLAGIASTSDSTGTLAWQKPAFSTFSFIPKAWAASACPTIWDAGSATYCSGNTMTLTYSECSPSSTSIATWNGSQIFTFNGQSCGVPSTAWTSGSMAHTVGAKTYRATGTGVKVWVNTTSVSGYQTPVSGGSTVSFVGALARTATISGIEYFATKTIGSETQTVWDQTVSTTAPLVIAGTGATRTIASGTTLVQNNRQLTSASVLVQTPLVFANTACCYPTSGALATTYSGTQTGTETLTFTTPCGAATYVDSSGKSSSVTLNHCL